MMSPAVRARVCLMHARQHFKDGSREVGIALFQEASRLVDTIQDPVDFLSMTCQIEKTTQRWLLPEA